jgi:hypothetical protein
MCILRACFSGEGFTAFFGVNHAQLLYMLLLCLDSLFFFPFNVVWALKTLYYSSWVFVQKKNTLSKKNRVSREDGPRFVFANVVARFLERASTRRSLALFAERGSFRNPLGFFVQFHNVNFFGAVGFCTFPIGIEWIRRRHFFPSTKDWTSKIL